MATDHALFLTRRLGFGTALQEEPPASPRDWAVQQIKTVPPLDFFGADGKSILAQLPSGAKPLEDPIEAAREFARHDTERARVYALSKTLSPSDYAKEMKTLNQFGAIPRWREQLLRGLTAVNGKSGVFERFWMFWANHFTVVPKDIVTLIAPMQRQLRRDMVLSFEEMLFNAVTSPAMVVFLDNIVSDGPNSKNAKNPDAKIKHDLNENLGRELLELHTVSPSAKYSQKDVTETALLLTGWQWWRPVLGEAALDRVMKSGAIFNERIHEPGTRRIMGKSYPLEGDGSGQIRALTKDLAAHPSTAKFLAFKLARAFIADDPPQESMDNIAAAFVKAKGNMIALHTAVIDEVIRVGEKYQKFSTPEVWLYQAHKLTGVPLPLAAPDAGGEVSYYTLGDMGERIYEASQPNGFPETRADWLSKEMLDRRVRMAFRLGRRAGAITPAALGAYAERLSEPGSPLARSVARAESRELAFSTLLASPQFLYI